MVRLTLAYHKGIYIYKYAEVFKGGIKVDPKKIKAIMHMDPPQNVASLQSTVLSELSEPLRRLCKSGAKWAWESDQQNTVESIKQVITSLPVLSCFDKTK